MSWVWIVLRVWRIIKEDLSKNGTKDAEWRTKVAAFASASRHFGATRNWTQLAEKSCYWRWVMDLLVWSTRQIHHGRALNGRAHSHQDSKRRGCSSPKPRWCWSLFLMSMELSTQNSCHTAKLLISTSTKHLATSEALSEGKKKRTAGNEVMAALSWQCSSS